MDQNGRRNCATAPKVQDYSHRLTSGIRETNESANLIRIMFVIRRLDRWVESPAASRHAIARQTRCVEGSGHACARHRCGSGGGAHLSGVDARGIATVAEGTDDECLRGRSPTKG